MANMRFRFRKTFRIIPGILTWTASKRGLSLNLNLGIYSKSWGTGGRRTTTLDVPGTSGIFWRKQEKVKDDPDDPDEGFSHFLQLLVIWGGFWFGLARLHFERLADGCQLEGHPHWWLLGMLGAQLLVFWVLWNTFRWTKGPLGLVLVAAAAYLQWKIFGNYVLTSLDC